MAQQDTAQATHLKKAIDSAFSRTLTSAYLRSPSLRRVLPHDRGAWPLRHVVVAGMCAAARQRSMIAATASICSAHMKGMTQGAQCQGEA